MYNAKAKCGDGVKIRVAWSYFSPSLVFVSLARQFHHLPPNIIITIGVCATLIPPRIGKPIPLRSWSD